jgi:hypothetical protein
MPVLENRLRIVAWNLNHRIREKVIPEGVATAILSLSPDVVVLTEYVEGPDHASFCTILKAYGLATQLHSEFKPRHNHVLIASKSMAALGTFVPPDTLPHAVSNCCHVRLADPSLDLVGLRVPVESPKQNRCYWDWFEPAIQPLLASPRCDNRGSKRRSPVLEKARYRPSEAAGEGSLAASGSRRAVELHFASRTNVSARPRAGHSQRDSVTRQDLFPRNFPFFSD